MQCSKCGTEIKDDYAICPGCGDVINPDNLYDTMRDNNTHCAMLGASLNLWPMTFQIILRARKINKRLMNGESVCTKHPLIISMKHKLQENWMLEVI